MKLKNNTDKYIIGKNENEDLEYLLSRCKQFIPDYNEELIRLAFNYCVTAHAGKLRKSGNKFYVHPLSVALIVIKEIPLDNESIAAALLHNVLDESDDMYNYEDIRFAFGATIAQIVEGITRIKFVESQHIDKPEQADNYRKLLLTLFSDIRIILIKLADKLDNMRTLQFVSSESQHKIAKETLDIYTPFANRFGLTRIKFELEDLAFKYVNPEAYKHIEEVIKGTHNERAEYVDKFKEPIIALLEKECLLEKENVKYKINGRAKNIYSIYNKTLIRNKNVEDLYDIFAIRIILDTDNPLLCFYVYGVVADYYKPIPETFKDYISRPKENGYRSLHTAVEGPKNRVVEVQIRTKQMHYAAEVGVAAHFRYKTGLKDTESVLEDDNLQHWLDEVRDIFDKIGTNNSYKLHNILSNNMLRGTIYVFTPHDEFIQLPKGASVLDFAFHIHTEIGLKCISAKVNGKSCPINYQLNSGDKVEIITSDKQQPTIEWLDYVVTPQANSKLLSYFKELKNKYIAIGKLIWQNKLAEKNAKSSNNEINFILKSLNYSDINSFFEALGKNDINIDYIYQIMLLYANNYKQDTKLNQSKITDKTLHHKLQNYNDYQYEFSSCCNPLPGDSIFGVMENDLLISIHTDQCDKYIKLLKTHPLDLILLDWELLSDYRPIVTLYVKAEDRDNLLLDIINTIIEDNIQLTSINYDINNSIFNGIISFKISNNIFISEIINKIELIDGVNSVVR